MAILTAGLHPPVYGQGYVPTHYTSKEGIGHDHVRTIVADSSGFIWMATWDGLTRFDGTDFVNYFHDPADSTSLPYFSASHIAVDSHDNLWVSTDNGILSLFDRATEEFRIIRSLGGVRLDDLVHFSSGPDGCLWILLGKGILRYDPLSRHSVFHPWKSKLHTIPPMRFFSYRIAFSDDGDPWLAGINIIEVKLGYEKQNGSNYAAVKGIYNLSRLPGRVGTFFGDSGFARFHSDSDGNTWLAAGTGLFKLDRKESTFNEYSGPVSNIPFDPDSPVIFYNHETGLNIRQPGSDSFITIPNSICGLPICYFFSDPGMLWFSYSLEGGTPDGVMKVIFTPSEFRLINPFPQATGTLTVFGVITDETGSLWLAARDRNYLIRISPDGRPDRINILNDRELNELWHPRAFLPDTGGMWIGYYNRKLVHYDLATGRMEDHYPAEWVHTICYDEDGNILIADEGVISYNPKTRKSVRLFSIGDSLNIFTFHRQGSVLWAGCSHSYLIRYDADLGKPEYIKITKGMTNIEDICDGGDGILWLATLGSGVCRYNGSTGESFFYTTAAGLSNNTTYSILRDKHDNIWVSTNNGLSAINPATGLIRTFSENDGLPIHEFNSDASWITEEGKFLFGGVGGCVEFDPLRLGSGELGGTQNRIILKELEVSGQKRILPGSNDQADTIILNKGDDNFHIEFVVPEYRYPERIRYRYKLNEVSKTWFYTDHKDKNINFSNLQPGWYLLEIQAAMPSGDWSPSKLVQIRILPYFYQQVWFIYSIPIIIALLAYLVIRLIVKQLKSKEKHKQDELKLESLGSQMNPHFIFNSLNSINYFISKNDKLAANRFIGDFAKLIRSILSNLSKDYVPLQNEIAVITDYLRIEHLRFGDKFKYEILVDSSIDIEDIEVTPGLIQSFIENSIWHGVRMLDDRIGMIRVEFMGYQNRAVLCRISDDGIGRTASQCQSPTGRQSRGIALVEERLKVINSITRSDHKITIEDLFPDKIETGTVVNIEIPAKQTYEEVRN